MEEKKTIFVIVGSASSNSANEKLVAHLASLTKDRFRLDVFTDLKTLPHFDPERSVNNPPEEIIAFRNAVAGADGVLICTPEYVFSIPSGLKNAIEWCVATTVFSGKPTGLITASASGQKGHEELQLILKTLMATVTEETSLLIQGIKGKLNGQGQPVDAKTNDALQQFLSAFTKLVTNK